MDPGEVGGLTVRAVAAPTAALPLHRWGGEVGLLHGIGWNGNNLWTRYLVH